MAAGSPFTLARFLTRALWSLFLVYATYNPSGYSYYHWILDYSGNTVLKIFIGLLLLAIYTNLAIITWRAMGLLGLSVTLIIFVIFVWVLDSVIGLDGPGVLSIIICVFFASILALGLSTSYVKMRIGGTVESHYIS